MSRVAKRILPTYNVEIIESERVLNFKGPLGTMLIKLPNGIVVNIDKSKNEVSVSGEVEMALKGTFVRLIENAIHGVTKGFEKQIKLSGVGYKASLDANRIKLTIGLSHDVFLEIPEGIKVKLPNIANITINSCNKELLGTFTDKLCKTKKYNVYNGTGVLEVGRFYRRKETKKK